MDMFEKQEKRSNYYRCKGFRRFAQKQKWLFISADPVLIRRLQATARSKLIAFQKQSLNTARTNVTSVLSKSKVELNRHTSMVTYLQQTVYYGETCSSVVVM